MTGTDDPAPGRPPETVPRDGRLAGVKTAALQRLQRVTWRSVLQVVVLILAVSVLVTTVANLDLDALVDELAGATWWLAGVAFVVAQLPRVAQTASTLGAAPDRLPFRPVYLLQLAQGYVALAVPSTAARVAMNVRFFQKQGFAPGAALAMGGLDGFAGFLVEATLLGGLLLFTPQTLHFDLDAPSLPEWGTILAVLAVLAVIIAVVSALLPHRRRQFLEWFRELLEDGRDAVRGLRSGRRVALLIGGNLGSTLGFAAALGLSVRALGTTVSMSDLVVIIISVSLLAGLLPVPGGIGVVEGGLTFGLVAAGVPEEQAFTAVILYRLATFYVPPAWGFLAFRTLERDGHL